MSSQPPDPLERVGEILDRALARRVSKELSAEVAADEAKSGVEASSTPSSNAVLLRALDKNVFGLCWLILGALVFLAGLIQRASSQRDGYVMIMLAFGPLIIGAWYVDRGLKAIRVQADALEEKDQARDNDGNDSPP